MYSSQHLDIQVSKDKSDDDVMKIVRIVRPEWDIKLKHLEGGKANQTVICHNGDDITGDNAVIVRTRFQPEEEILFNFKNEIPVIKKASEAGLCGRVLATFINGSVLQYLPGRVLNWEDLENSHIMKLVAETMANFHNLLWGEGDLPGGQTYSELQTISEQPKLFPRIRQAMECIPDNLSAAVSELCRTELWPKEELAAEVDCISGIVEKLNLPISLAHNDVQIKNLIYDKNKDKVYLIDYECTSFNYEAVDFANLFIETGIRTLGIVPPDITPATDEQIGQFLKFYIMKRFHVQENDSQFHKLFTRYYSQVKAFKTLNCLYWSSIAQVPCMIDEEVWTNGDFDFRSVSRNYRKTYLQGREEMLGLLTSLGQERQ